ncbi:pilus assembly PilX family protein [Dyella silvatica]|uniref:pilus assembly PilX family protein n=1 Tax=Dyella silvatica TaxID=2992128 RepID=UPI00224CF1FD|nr:PilX N-terminal domain-containing pilus assembly protein [Dyella silvatica]
MSISGNHPSRGQMPRAQRGVVLVVALVFLLLLTMLAISATGRSLLQERMAGGLRNAQMAEMAAETALRGAEWRLWKAGNNASVNCGSTVITDCYVYDAARPIASVEKFRNSAGWEVGGATEYKGHDGGYDYTTLSGSGMTADEKKLAVLAKNPHYIIEDMGPELPPGVGKPHESGVTARATGGNLNTVRVLESTFAAKGE